MKRVDDGEFFKAKEDNKFSEYKSFKAERYVLNENINPPKEEFEVPEISVETKIEEKEAVEFTNIKNKIDKIASKTSSSQIVSKVGTTMATVSTSAVAAAIFVSVVSTSLYPFISNYLSFSLGADYLVVEVDSNNILEGSSSFSNLSASDFYLEFDTDCYPKKVTLKEGTNSYLFTGFKPDQNYTYNIVCTALSGKETTCYSNKIKTSAISNTTKVIMDEQATYFEYDENEEKFKLNYSLYISDFSNLYSDYRVYLCGSKPSDNKTIENYIYTNNNLDSKGYLSNTTDYFDSELLYKYASGFKTKSLYLCTIASKANNIEIISVDEVKFEYPSSWTKSKAVIDKSNERIESSSTDIKINGKFDYIDDSSKYKVIVTQYDKDLNTLSENEVTDINLDTESKSYSYNFKTNYGLKSFKYTIYSLDENDDLVSEYTSDLKNYDEDQSYLANYKIVDGSDAEITFENDRAKIKINPSFSSSKDNFYYVMELICDEEVLDTYKGKDIAEFDIPVNKLNDSMHFVYYECGEFNNEEIRYQNNSTSEYTFGYPDFNLDSDFIYEDQRFGIIYSCNMPFSYDTAKLKFYIDDGTDIKTVEVEEIETSDARVLFNEFNGELGDVTITAELTFKDNQTNSKEHTINICSKKYSMKYLVDVENVVVDPTNSDASTLPTTVYLNIERIPENYKVKAYSGSTLVSSSEMMVDRLEISNIPYDSKTDLKIDIVDGEDNIYKSYNYSIYYPSVKESYTSPTSYDYVSPDDSVITYNDDGTINLYRKVNFKSDKEDVCYNASLYTYSTDGNRSLIYNCFGTGDYAKLENIIDQNYYFEYYDCIKVNDVIYQMNLDQDFIETSTPFVSKTIEASAKASISSSSTYINISITDGYIVGKEITIDGTVYTLDTIDDSLQSATIRIENLTDLNEVKINVSGYYKNYDSFQNDIVMKGNKSYEIIATLEKSEG